MECVTSQTVTTSFCSVLEPHPAKREITRTRVRIAHNNFLYFFIPISFLLYKSSAHIDKQLMSVQF